MSAVLEWQEGTCTNPDCRVSETLQCLEGLELSNCPHFGPVGEGDGEEAQQVQEPVPTGVTIQLPSAQVLNYDGASRVLRE